MVLVIHVNGTKNIVMVQFFLKRKISLNFISILKIGLVLACL